MIYNNIKIVNKLIGLERVTKVTFLGELTFLTFDYNKITYKMDIKRKKYYKLESSKYFINKYVRINKYQFVKIVNKLLKAPNTGAFFIGLLYPM